MIMKNCPDCGEKYSHTYVHCPFCEEEESLRRGEKIHRSGRGGKRAVRRNRPGMLSPILVVVILLLIALLVYLLFGGAIAEKLGFGAELPVTLPPVEAVTPTPPDTGDGPVVMPGDEAEPAPEPEPDTVDVTKLPETLKVNNADFTLKAGETFTVKVTSGGSEPYTWVSDDDGVASVDETGKVTAISAGKATLTVYNDTGKCNVLVYVRGTAANPAIPGSETPASGGVAKLSSEDFTLSVGQPDVKLTISGITTYITWATNDPNIATVSDKGVVHAVGKGTTKVTATYDGKTLTCVVRVPR